jgi:uncharacterized protein YjbI with pentapeptide repeats
MANQRHVGILLRDSVAMWNLWRKEEPDVRPDLSDANLSGARLTGANLSGAKLSRANLSEAHLSGARLTGATLSGADLFEAHLNAADLSGVDLSQATLLGAHLSGAKLTRADLSQARLLRAHLDAADLSGATLSGAKLTRADLFAATLSGAKLTGAKLSEANLTRANLTRANLTRANLSDANLTGATLSGAKLSEAHLTGALCVGTTFTGATLTGCNVYGISAWDLNLDDTTQADLRITPWDEKTNITVDNLEVAQFLHVLLTNRKMRTVLDTITSKVVLILGRFSRERKPVLDAVRDALRNHPNGYVPVLFDFIGPDNCDTTETVTLLARMARFVVADLTDPGSVPYELAKIVPDAHVPVQPLLLEGATTFSMAGDLWMAHEMLAVVRYTTADELVATLSERVIVPAEAKVTEIQRERATALLRSGLAQPLLQGS